MAENKSLYTIAKEISNLVGISPQAVNKRVKNEVENGKNSDIKAHVIKDESGKYSIDSEGELAILKLYGLSNQHDQPDSQLPNQPKGSQAVGGGVGERVDQLKNVKMDSELQFLRERVKAQEKQIDGLQDELSKEREHSRKITDQLATIADQQQKLMLGEMAKSNPALLSESAGGSASAESKKRSFFDRFRRSRS